MRKSCLVFLIILYLAGCSSNPVDSVKNGTLGNDKSLTVGKAIDNYNYFKNTKWKSITTANGKKIVEAICYIDITKSPTLDSKIDINNVFEQFQFTINLDKTFEMSWCGVGGQTNDEIKLEPQQNTNMSVCIESLKNIYQNSDIIYDPQMIIFAQRIRFAKEEIKEANRKAEELKRNTKLELMTALYARQISKANELIGKGVDINYKDDKSGLNGATALILASGKGDNEIVQLLLVKGADVNMKDDEGATALVISSMNGHKEIVQLLLENGADINAKTNNGATALIEVCRRGRGLKEYYYGAASNVNDKAATEIVQLLLNNGADIKIKDNHGKTALIGASENGLSGIVQLLLEKGADINAETNDGIDGRTASNED